MREARTASDVMYVSSAVIELGVRTCHGLSENSFCVERFDNDTKQFR